MNYELFSKLKSKITLGNITVFIFILSVITSSDGLSQKLLECGLILFVYELIRFTIKKIEED